MRMNLKANSRNIQGGAWDPKDQFRTSETLRPESGEAEERGFSGQLLS